LQFSLQVASPETFGHTLVVDAFFYTTGKWTEESRKLSSAWENRKIICLDKGMGRVDRIVRKLKDQEMKKQHEVFDTEI
jgi:hypothetical protein